LALIWPSAGLLVWVFLVQSDPDKTVFEKVCGKCHAATMVHDLKTEEEWSDTVDNMTGIGAKGTEEEFNAVLRYLSRNFTKVNINTATAAQIAPVLDIGETVAQAIVDFRTRQGAFSTLGDLAKVPGLDAKKLEARKDRIAFR
jgi:competence protein ComEA